MKKWAIFTLPGVVILALVSGLFIYGAAKEKKMEPRENTKRMTGAVEAAGVGVHAEALPERIETATFAMG